MEVWMKQAIENNNVQLTLIAIGILLLFLFLRKIFITYVYAIVLKVSKKSPTELFTYVLHAFERPLQYVFVIIGINVAVKYFPYIDQSNLLFTQIMKSALVLAIAMGLYNLAENTSILFAKINDRGKVYLDRIISSFLSKILRFVVIAISIAIVADVFGFNVNGFVAGLGLGGLAFALAAQDAIANLFGGFVIVTDKPFKIDDWIKTASVEGVVEDITFRSTRIRTFEDAIVAVPNASLVQDSITNYSKRNTRDVYFTIPLTFDTPPEKIKKVVRYMDDRLNNHDGILEDSVYVSSNEYTEDGLSVMIYFFTKTANWRTYLAIREEINLELLELLHTEGIHIAVPSRRLYVEGQAEDVARKERATEQE